jgi:hypothetical protein
MNRLFFCIKVGVIHLAVSAIVALVCAALGLRLWYPYPYDVLAGGRQLILIIISVDVICGPLLTMIVANPEKKILQLWRDFGIVVLLQICALSYGIYSLVEARPVWLAFEGDRFRVVSVPDIDPQKMKNASERLRHLSFQGPRPVGVELLKSSDPRFPQSIQLAMQGIPPAFRPERWRPYDEHLVDVIAAAKPLGNLYKKTKESEKILRTEAARLGLSEKKLGYLPLVSKNSDDWIVLIDLDDAQPKAFLNIDPW